MAMTWSHLLAAHQLANRLADRGRIGLLAAEVTVPELVGGCAIRRS